MKNIKAVHIISAIFHVLSVIATVCLIIALVAVTAISAFLIALPGDTMEFSAQGNVGAIVKTANIISNPFAFIEDMDNEEHLDKGPDGEVSYQAKDGVLSGYVKGYEKYNQGVATFSITPDGVINGYGKSQKYVLNNKQLGFILLPTVLSLMFLLTAVFYGRRIFKGLKKCTTPFTEVISKNMLKLSAVILGYSIIPTIVGKIYITLIGLSGIENTGVKFGYPNISVTTAIIALVLFVLSLVFSYGVSLQKQADETL